LPFALKLCPNRTLVVIMERYFKSGILTRFIPDPHLWSK